MNLGIKSKKCDEEGHLWRVIMGWTRVIPSYKKIAPYKVCRRCGEKCGDSNSEAQESRRPQDQD